MEEFPLAKKFVVESQVSTDHNMPRERAFLVSTLKLSFNIVSTT